MLYLHNNLITMKICFFCSACADINKEYFDAAEALGRWTGENGHALVFGGTSLGLMETVARAARDAGALVIGVVPRIVEQRGAASTLMDVEIPCETLSDRKELMMLKSDAFIALPGGIGTLDEVFTVAASATIGYHHKPLILYNTEGFYDPLIALLDRLKDEGMIRGDWRQVITVASTPEEVAAAIG